MSQYSEKMESADTPFKKRSLDSSSSIPLVEHIHITEKKGNGTIFRFEYTRILNFLHIKGYRIFNNEIIKIENNIAVVINREDVFKFLLNHIETTFKDDNLTNAFYKEGELLILKKDGLLYGIKEVEKQPLRDTCNCCYVSYLNGVVVVTSDKIKLIKYSELDNFVWQEQIIEREFNEISYYDINPNVYDKCLRNSTNNPDHFKSVLSAIGYLIHNYKDQRLTKAVIINDENLEDEDEAGGSGKGLIIKAISHVRPVLIINGKNADPIGNRFFLQGVTHRTCVVSIDDPKRDTNLEPYFSYLTEGMTVEEKHKKSKFIPFKESPKFSFTTNYTIKGDSSSHKRRRFDIFLNGHYSSHNTPSMEFGHEFFVEWDNSEWNRFDFFIIKCAQLYLKKGLIDYESREIVIKKLQNETSADFYSLMENSYNQNQVQYSYSEVRGKLIAVYGDKYNFLNNHYKIIAKWIKLYASFKGYILETDRKSEGMWFSFKMNKEDV